MAGESFMSWKTFSSSVTEETRSERPAHWKRRVLIEGFRGAKQAANRAASTTARGPEGRVEDVMIISLARIILGSNYICSRPEDQEVE